jgi:hypothetical protein
VAVLADICPSCGGDPDLRLLELGAGAGRRRRGGADRPPRRPTIGWKRWTPIITVVVVLWGFLALTAGDDGDEEATDPPAPTTTREPKREPTTSTTRRPRPSTTTTTTVPLTDRAPLLGEETGLVVMINTGRTRLIDLDSGVEVVLSFTANVLGAVDGRLLVSRNGQVAWWPAPFDGTGAEAVELDLDTSDAWADSAGSVVWFASNDGSGWTMVQAFDHDGTARIERRLPLSSWPVGAMGDDLVIGAPGGTFTVSPAGAIDHLSSGQPLSTSSDRVVVHRCDEELECGYDIVTRDGDVVARLSETPAVLDYGPWGQIVSVSPTGQVAQIVVQDEGGSALTIDGVDVEWEAPRSGVSAAAWSSDGRWLVVGDGEGDLAIIDGERGTVVTTVEWQEGNEPAWRLMVLEGIDLQP